MTDPERGATGPIWSVACFSWLLPARPSRGSSTTLDRLALTTTIAIIGRKATPLTHRGVAQGLLHVVDEEQEDAEHAGTGDQHRQEGAAAVAVEHHPGRQQRAGRAGLPEREGGEQRHARGQEARRWTACASCGRRRCRTHKPTPASTRSLVPTLARRRGAHAWARPHPEPATWPPLAAGQRVVMSSLWLARPAT